MEKNIHIVQKESNEVSKLSADVHSIAIIGLGNMGLAFTEGMQRSDAFSNFTIRISNGNRERTEQLLSNLQREDSIRVCEDNLEAVDNSHIICLSLKQAVMREELHKLADAGVISDDKLIVSLAAGVRLDTIKKWVGNTSQPVARIMPNTAASEGNGVFGWTVSDEVTVGDVKILRNLCSSLGVSMFVDGDEGIDTITALSGSGIAYFFEMGNQLEQAALRLGVAPGDARRIAKQTLYGAAIRAMNKEESFDTLRTQVTSKGGTTEQALKVFTEHNFSDLIHHAVDAAKDKATALGKEFSVQ